MGDGADMALEQMMDLDELQVRCGSFEEAVNLGEEELLYDYYGGRFPGVFSGKSLRKALAEEKNVPRVMKQSSSGEPERRADGIMGRVVPVSDQRTGLKILVFGNPKSGKTRFASTFPRPVLIIGTEDGTASITDMKGVDFVLIRSSEEFGEVVESLPGKYKSVALDLAGGLQDIITKEVLGLDEVPVQRTYGMTGGPGVDGRQIWGAIGMQFKERMKRLLDLADQHLMDVCVIAHERNFKDDNAGGPGSDLIMPTIGAALTPGAAGWLHANCSILVQTFKRQQTREVADKIGDKEVKTRKPTGKIEYCLRVGPHACYMTEFRRRGTEPLPDCIVDPTFDKLKRLT